jgi:hypothetical protein
VPGFKSLADIRGSLPTEAHQRLLKLQAFFGHRRPMATVEFLINQATGRYLCPTEWPQTQAKALQTLRRLKPNLLIEAHDITGVAFTNQGNTVEVSVSLEPQPYKIPRREWEK